MLVRMTLLSAAVPRRLAARSDYAWRRRTTEMCLVALLEVVCIFRTTTQIGLADGNVI